MKKERYCKICGKTLSCYNKSNQCFHHTNHNELEFIGNTKEKEIKMPEKKLEVCDLCGKRKQVINANGKKICSTCAVVINAAKHRPETLIKALEQYQAMPLANTSDDIAELIKERDRLKWSVVETQRAREELKATLEKWMHENIELQKEITALKESKELTNNIEYTIESSTTPNLDKTKLALLLAEMSQGILEGRNKVSNRIFRELRKLAA